MSEVWERIEPTDVHKVGWRTITTKHFKLADGTVIEFDTVGAEGTHDVAVVALTAEHNVVIARLFRPGPEEVMDELPGGGVDKDEQPEIAAVRELAEETGYEPGVESKIIELTKTEGLPSQDAYATARKHYFLITNVVLTKQQKLETEETIVVDTISISQLIANAKAGRMTDSAAVLAAYDRLIEIDKEVS